MRGGYAELSVTAESISFDTPPDDFQILPVELGIDIIKHPRYAWALNPFVSDNSTSTKVGDTDIYYTQIKESIIRMIQAYIDSPFFPSADQVNGLIQNNVLTQIANGKINVTVPNPNFVAPTNSSTVAAPVSWNGKTSSLDKIASNVQNLVVSVPVDLTNDSDPITIAIAAAKEIISKLWRREDAPYLVGYEVTWTQYFFAPVYLNCGGYLEDPFGIVPFYFLSPPTWSAGNVQYYQDLARSNFVNSGYAPDGDMSLNNMDTVGANGATSIFDQIVKINPQSYSDTGLDDGTLKISWLRKSDEVVYERTWFKVSRKWIGAPIGCWDTNLYLHFGEPRPQVASDFNQLPI
jgi:hypothetical protein